MRNERTKLSDPLKLLIAGGAVLAFFVLAFTLPGQAPVGSLVTVYETPT